MTLPRASILFHIISITTTLGNKAMALCSEHATRSGDKLVFLVYTLLLRPPEVHSAQRDFSEGFGPGPRDSNCLICQEPLNASKPTVTHQGSCLNTCCRQCFMGNVIHTALRRPIVPTQCPACRARIVVNIGQISRIERVGTDGAHAESFWPLLRGIEVHSVDDLSPDVLQRAHSLGSYGVSFAEHDGAGFLERAIICPSVSSFLAHVMERGGYLQAQDPPNSPSRRRYIRYQDHVSVAFVRWLHADRDLLRSSFVRWCIRDEQTRPLDPEDRPLGQLVWKGLLDDTIPFPQNVTHFNIFRFAKNWYLVPESTPNTRTQLESQFLAIGDSAWLHGWCQQGEELTCFRVAVPWHIHDPHPVPHYVVRLGAVGLLSPSRDATYILRAHALRNTLDQWPGNEYERKVMFGDEIAPVRLRFDLTAAREGMPRCPRQGVEALRAYLSEVALKGAETTWREQMREDDIMPIPVLGRVRMIVGTPVP